MFTNVGNIEPPKPPRQEVMCPEHNVAMVYHASDDSLKCPASGCDYVSMRSPAFADFWEVREPGRIYRGKMSLVQDDAGSIYLHLEDIGGMVDVTNLIQTTLAPDIPGRHEGD